MDAELRDAIAGLSAQLSNVSADARAAAEVAREVRSAQTRLDARVDAFGRRLGRLEKHAFGSDPPPDPGTPLVRQVSEHSGELAELAGQVVSTRSELAELRAINLAQSKALGLARPDESVTRKASAFLFSREGAKAIVAVLTAIAALAGAMRSAEALRAPAPSHEVK